MASSPNITTSPPPSNPSDTQQLHKCLWIDCSKSLPDPESLYTHLCNDHIGRKSTNNLCLTCKWLDCGTSCAKRDHITSHLRGLSLSPPPPLSFPPDPIVPDSPHPFERLLTDFSKVALPSYLSCSQASKSISMLQEALS
ncbi:hypothetical protein EW146_g5819 [Bondarzewia mesenterica]|uniref:C2H2-type domain-containing protein n=1 Tax=Bondarzewia mesenterica TaxID=1095465 RepID=A0A4S4LQE1_9AGAM|nr:hypothetical protein EW146_g5819 [Bondarzewia mesenterica]